MTWDLSETIGNHEEKAEILEWLASPLSHKDLRFLSGHVDKAYYFMNSTWFVYNSGRERPSFRVSQPRLCIDPDFLRPLIWLPRLNKQTLDLVWWEWYQQKKTSTPAFKELSGQCLNLWYLDQVADVEAQPWSNTFDPGWYKGSRAGQTWKHRHIF